MIPVRAWNTKRVVCSSLSSHFGVDVPDATAVPPEWLWSIFSGGYKHLGTELSLTNTHLHKKGVVKGDGETDVSLSTDTPAKLLMGGMYGWFFSGLQEQAPTSPQRISTDTDRVPHAGPRAGLDQPPTVFWRCVSHPQQ